MAESGVTEDQDGSGGGMMRWIMMGVLLLVAVGASVGGTLYFLGNSPAPEPVEEVRPEVIYHTLRPGFVVNFTGTGRSRLLQVEITLRTVDQATVNAVTDHDPLIRNRIIDVLTDQDARELQTEEGKIVLRQQLLDAVNQVLQDEGVATRVDAVLFGSFVIQ